jgi:ABC-type uncharacterized transport system substrate-binding protein
LTLGDSVTQSIRMRFSVHTEGRAEGYAEIAAEFVRLKPDVIVGAGTEAAIAAKQATSSIPIVFPTAGDPIGSGLVASLARPGGNVTGLSNLGTDLAAKRIEILREVFPGLSRLAVMANADYSGGVTERKEIDAAARMLGLEIIPLPIRRVEDIASKLKLRLRHDPRAVRQLSSFRVEAYHRGWRAPRPRRKSTNPPANSCGREVTLSISNCSRN